MRKSVVINLFAGPGAGKSTTAAGLFFVMKTMGLKAELVREYAKDLEYEGALKRTSQIAILKEQERRQRCLLGKVDWVITDSPLVLGPVYTKDALRETVTDASNAAFSCYTNINIWIKRVKPYQGYGRSQSEDQARMLDGDILWHLNEQNIPIHFDVDGDSNAPMKIVEAITGYLTNVFAERIAAEAACN
jgi:hypothetical protein